MLAYIMDHQRSGDFLMTVFSNDLQGAIMRADLVTFRAERHRAVCPIMRARTVLGKRDRCKRLAV